MVVEHSVGLYTYSVDIGPNSTAMGNKRMCGSADAATGKRQIKFAMLSADVWVKGRCANNSCHVHY